MAIRLTQEHVDVGGPVTTGNLRVSTQYVEAVTQTTAGKLRVTSQYVDVLVSAGATTYAKSASNNLALLQTASGIVQEQSATSPLPLVHAVVYAKNMPASASNSMVLSDAVAKTVPVSATTPLVLISSESHFNYIADRNVVEHILAFTQLVESSDTRSGASSLGLIDSVDVRGPIKALANNQLFLSDLSRSLNKYIDVSSALDMGHTLGMPIDLSITQALGITDLAYMSFVEHTLALTHVAAAGRSPGVQIQVMTLTQTLVPGGTFRRTIIDVLGVGHSLTYFDDTPCNRKEYAPFMGDNTVPNSKTAPASSIPAPQADTSLSDPCDPQRFLLYYPARGARSVEIGIRAPEFGNRDRNAYTRINRETRGGKLIVFADTTWPKIRTMLVTFVALPKTAVDAIQTLFKDRLGQVIGITDWEGNEWEGVVTDPEQPVVQDGKRGWTVTFAFEGQIIDGYSPGHALGVADDPTSAKDPGANSALGLTDEVGGAQPAGDRQMNMDIQQVASGVVV